MNIWKNMQKLKSLKKTQKEKQNKKHPYPRLTK